MTAAAASSPPATGRLLIACPDARGIVAAVAGFIADHGGNLLDADQHTDHEHGEFFMRAVFDLTGCDLPPASFAGAFAPLAERHTMRWRVKWSHERKRVAILVGRQAHCLQDLLMRAQAGELAMEIPFIISNHADLEPMARSAGIEFRHHRIIGGSAGQDAQEAAVRRDLDAARIDLVVLARYMRVLRPPMLSGYEERIINIHHSFLPAFAGGDPYRQAYDRGVKIIGATSHFVTEDLDEGPIIAQSVIDVSHHDSVEELKRKGRDLERLVLARAVRAYLDDRVLVAGNKTVVFRS